MKLNEIMIVRKNDGRDQLKIFQVDDSTLARLTRIRGNFYADDPRLTSVKDLPEHKKPITDDFVITAEQMARAEAALNLHKMLCEAGERSRAGAAIQPQPERPLTPEETWRHDPALRAEFNNNLNAYLAYCKGVASGRYRIYGRG